MGNTFNNIIIQPCFHLYEDIITEVNIEFTDLIGFTRNELLGKSLMEIGYLLKIELEVLSENTDIKCSKYIFTKRSESVV